MTEKRLCANALFFLTVKDSFLSSGVTPVNVPFLITLITVPLAVCTLVLHCCLLMMGRLDPPKWLDAPESILKVVIPVVSAERASW